MLVQNKLHFKIIGVLFSLPLSNLMKGGQEILGLNLCVNFTARFGACCVPSSQLIWKARDSIFRKRNGKHWKMICDVKSNPSLSIAPYMTDIHSTNTSVRWAPLRWILGNYLGKRAEMKCLLSFAVVSEL